MVPSRFSPLLAGALLFAGILLVMSSVLPASTGLAIGSAPAISTSSSYGPSLAVAVPSSTSAGASSVGVPESRRGFLAVASVSGRYKTTTFVDAYSNAVHSTLTFSDEVYAITSYGNDFYVALDNSAAAPTASTSIAKVTALSTPKIDSQNPVPAKRELEWRDLQISPDGKYLVGYMLDIVNSGKAAIYVVLASDLSTVATFDVPAPLYTVGFTQSPAAVNGPWIQFSHGGQYAWFMEKDALRAIDLSTMTLTTSLSAKWGSNVDFAISGNRIAAISSGFSGLTVTVCTAPAVCGVSIFDLPSTIPIGGPAIQPTQFVPSKQLPASIFYSEVIFLPDGRLIVGDGSTANTTATILDFSSGQAKSSNVPIAISPTSGSPFLYPTFRIVPYKDSSKSFLAVPKCSFFCQEFLVNFSATGSFPMSIYNFQGIMGLGAWFSQPLWHPWKETFWVANPYLQAGSPGTYDYYIYSVDPKNSMPPVRIKVGSFVTTPSTVITGTIDPFILRMQGDYSTN